jgi:secreted PhoX family phosphatase
VARSISRRSFLRGGATLLAAPAALQALAARRAHAGRPRALASPVASPYGEPVLQRDLTTGLELIALPPDFTYRTLLWTGDPMSDGSESPANPDGMAVVQVVPGRAGDLILIRNHELSIGRRIGTSSTPIYDPTPIGPNGIGGGTTTLTFRRGELVDSQASLAGTAINCAGGPTPWGSWLTCEETINDGTVFRSLVHGFVFEVPAPSLGPASAVPITDMGLMKHEAAAVDPRTGFVYETEDATGHSGFYRFRPNDTNGRVGSLEAGGVLEMLRVVGQDGADLREPLPGDVHTVDWVPIGEPGYLPPEAEGQILYDGPSGPYAQGLDLGGATFHRLEGCWYDAGSIWFTDTTGGANGNGVVWRYEPSGDPAAPGMLEAFFVAESAAASNNIDNLTVSPRGGILCCEDGGTADGVRLVGFTRDGASFPFAINQVRLTGGVPGKPGIAALDYRSFEWAGACFDPSGRWLFANLYRPGITLAITGPWARGPL